MDELHQGTSESNDLKTGPNITASSLGSRVFRRRFGLNYAYVAGAMYRGIASPELVIRMGKAGLIGFFGTGGLSLDQIERGIQCIQSQLSDGESYGMNLLANYGDPNGERKTVDLYLRHNIRRVEAAAFTQMTPALVLFRLTGLRRDESGRVVCANQVIAKVSRPEVAEAFMSPAPQHIVQQLLSEGSISAAEAELGRTVPMSHDICVEADSGGHTDGAIPTVILPTMVRLRDHILRERKYADPVCVGLAGGIGTPEAAAAAFLMGADFILTGSINQCTPEAGISEDAKRLLLEMNIQDTDYAPAGDMFEMGAKVQVLKKGVFFPARANKLYGLYSHFDSLGDLPDKIQQQLQTTYFKRSFLDIWNDMRSHLEQEGRLSEIRKAELNGKYKMSLVFRWYFHYSTQLAFAGQGDDRVNYQLHTGPALGAFNQWVKGTDLEPLANRHVDEIGKRLMIESARFINNRYASMAECTRQESMGG
jgi:trans-AT polyketide synthase/acyltransferase/oxidoreductase domain-containing protein